MTSTQEWEAKVIQDLEGLVLQRFYDPEVGKPYKIDDKAKSELVDKIRIITQQIPTATSWLYHLVLATEILRVPAGVQGDVIECGSWKGGSAASLSLVCSMVGRTLLVCDSFEGLPEDDPEVVHQYPHVGIFGWLQKGMCEGGIEEVRENVTRFGDVSVCRFVPGFFSDSLKSLRDPIVFAFLDVDLASSMRDCIKYIWPLMLDGGLVFTDDSCDMEVVRIWFDDLFWQREIGCRAPGYVGSGCGLPLSPNFSSLGYSRKVTRPEQQYNRISWLYYPDSPIEGPMFPNDKT